MINGINKVIKKLKQLNEEQIHSSDYHCSSVKREEQGIIIMGSRILLSLCQQCCASRSLLRNPVGYRTVYIRQLSSRDFRPKFPNCGRYLSIVGGGVISFLAIHLLHMAGSSPILAYHPKLPKVIETIPPSTKLFKSGRRFENSLIPSSKRRIQWSVNYRPGKGDLSNLPR